MAKKQNKAKLLIFLCWLAYTVGYIGRMNYAASMVEIISKLNTTKTEAGLVSSFFFFSYGIGQLVNGLLSHKYNSRIMIFISLFLASILNIIMPFMKSISAMKYLWALNGFSQSILWSSIIKLQAEYLEEKYINLSIIVMSTTVALGTFFAYGLSALFVMLGNYRITFYIASGLLLISAFVWLVGVKSVEETLPKYEKKIVVTTENEKVDLKKYLVVAFIFIVLCAIGNGFIKDGITTWVPNLLYETYGIEKYFSIILTLILPLISILGAYFTRLIHKYLPNNILISGICYGLSAVAVLIIFLLYTKSLVLAIIFFAIVACLMSGINNILTSALPFQLRCMGNSGAVAGVINTFCYVGSTLSSFLLGMIADKSGWNSVIILLLVISVVLFIIITIYSKFWKKNIVSRIGE